MSKGDLNCWLCDRVFRNYPDHFYAFWDKIDDIPIAICEKCMPKAQRLYKRQICKAESVG